MLTKEIYSNTVENVLDIASHKDMQNQLIRGVSPEHK